MAATMTERMMLWHGPPHQSRRRPGARKGRARPQKKTAEGDDRRGVAVVSFNNGNEVHILCLCSISVTGTRYYLLLNEKSQPR